MPCVDMPLDELRAYNPDVPEPDDFDEFWAGTLGEAHSYDLDATSAVVDAGLRAIDVYDVTFRGYGGHPIKAWLRLPAGTTKPLPGVVQFVGYGGGRGLAIDNLLFAAAGYAHLIMDTRGQGSSWGSGGDTADPAGAGPAFPGYMTRGILDHHDHYYRRVYTDAVRAVEALIALGAAESGNIAVTGGSQGGGITIAAAALSPHVCAASPDVPFLVNFPRALQVAQTNPYLEVVKYLSVHRDQVDQAMRTLSYLDGVTFARRSDVPALYSVALMDETCPPSTVFSSFNAWACPDKDIAIYPFNNHEGGESYQDRRRLEFFARVLR